MSDTKTQTTPLYDGLEFRKRYLLGAMQKIVSRLSRRLEHPAGWQSVEAMKDDLFYAEVLAKQSREGKEDVGQNGG